MCLSLSKRMAYFIVLCGGILWGTTGTAQTFVPETVDPFVVSTLRLSISGLVLSAILFMMKRIQLRNLPWKHIVIAAIAIALFQYSFFTSVRLTGVAVGTVVTIGSAPIFTGILEWIVLRSRPSRQWFIATMMAIIGCGLLFFNKELVIINNLGVTIALCGGFLFATYSFLNKPIVEKVDAIEGVAIVFVISALLFLPFSFSFSREGLFTTSGILAVLYIALITTALAYVLYSVGLKYIPSSSATTLALAEPFTAAILSVVIVGEVLNFSAWFGVFLLLAGILILTIQPNFRFKRIMNR
jgi:DME family drug/metabolite transporter